MPKILETKSIWFNDVVLIAQPGAVKSRKEIPKEISRIIVSPMNSIVGKTFAAKATSLGLSVTIPRYFGVEKELEIFNACENKDNLYCSIGLNDIARIQAFSKAGCKNFLVDVASGYLPQIGDTVKMLHDNTYLTSLILGNVHTYTGAKNLNDIVRAYNKFSYIKLILRCGIGNGIICQSSDQTGYNRGQLTEILECAEINNVNNNTFIASDGGLKNGGYISKAFLAGSQYVFVGSIFSKALEAETHLHGDGTYWGLASDKNQIVSTGVKSRHSEGKVTTVNKEELQPLNDIVEELWGAISSAVSYSGHSSLTSAIGQGVFEIKHNSLPPKNR